MLLRELLAEGPSAKSTITTIIADIGNPIESVYRTMTQMAEKFYNDKGNLKGFSLVAAGVGARWYNNFYFNKLQNELYDLTKLAPRHSLELKDFLRGEERSGQIELPKRFRMISRELPDILERIAKKIDSNELYRSAIRWQKLRNEYENFLNSLEDEDDEDNTKPTKNVKQKSELGGLQSQQANNIVNMILAKLSPKIAGDIRNSIARSPNKLSALQNELERRGLDVGALSETASAGATSAGNIATVVSPHVAIGNVKKYGKGSSARPPKTIQAKNPDGTAKNALDLKTNIFGSNAVKR